MITVAAAAIQSTAHHRSVVRLLSSPSSASVCARWLRGSALGCGDEAPGAAAAGVRVGVVLAAGAADTVWVTVAVTVGCAGVFLGFGFGLGVGGGVGTPVVRTLRRSVPNEVPT